MMKKLIYKLFILFFFTYAINQIRIPSHDLEDWYILNDKMPWIGYQYFHGFPWCRATQIFPYSIDEIEYFIGNFNYYSSIFNRIESSIRVDSNIVYLKVDYPFFLSDRDYIVEYYSWEDNYDVVDGTHIPHPKITYYQWHAVHHPDYPVYDDIVRLVNASGEWQLVYISPDSTKVSYSWNGELLGDFPSFSLHKAWKTGGMEIIEELRTAIENKHK